MDSYITWPYQIADHYCRITWVYNTTLNTINERTTESLGALLNYKLQI